MSTIDIGGSASGSITPTPNTTPVSSSVPLPISTEQAKAYFTGLETYLLRVAKNGVLTYSSDADAVAQYLAREIRTAQGMIQDQTRRPFFVTHYCTEELANQLAMVQGADFDEIMLPLTYDVASWCVATGRTELPWAPVNLQKQTDGTLTPVKHYWLALQGATKFAEIPLTWLNADTLRAVIHLLPQALTDLGVSYFSLFAMQPGAWRAGLSEHVPLLVHVDYFAGLVERVAVGGGTFDPAAYPKNTRWPQSEVSEYQEMIGKLLAAKVYRLIAPAINRGGVSLSIDGVSRSVNTQVLTLVADQQQQEVQAWIEGRGKAKSEGAGWVFVGR